MACPNNFKDQYLLMQNSFLTYQEKKKDKLVWIKGEKLGVAILKLANNLQAEKST